MTDAARGLLRPYVLLVVLHSLGVGLGLLLMPHLAVTIGGFPEPATLFFMHQGGVFHLVIAGAYWMEFRRHGTVSLMIFAKTVATIFLTTAWLLGSPWLVGASALGDGLMAAIAWHVSRPRG